ncbi:hypothetical protein BDAP_000615 [Binucleata daphniae]
MFQYIIATRNGAVPHIIDTSSITAPLLVFFDELYYKDSFYYANKQTLKNFLNTKQEIYLVFKNKKRLETKKGMYDISEAKYNEIVNIMQPDYYEVYGKRNNTKRQEKRKDKENCYNEFYNNNKFIYTKNTDNQDYDMVKDENHAHAKNICGNANDIEGDVNGIKRVYLVGCELTSSIAENHSGCKTIVDDITPIRSHVVQSFDNSLVTTIYNPETIDEFLTLLKNNKKIMATKFINNITENKNMIYFDNNIIFVTKNYNCNCCLLHKGYLEHLFKENEISALTLTNIHNYKQLDAILAAINKDDQIIEQLKITHAD